MPIAMAACTASTSVRKALHTTCFIRRDAMKGIHRSKAPCSRCLWYACWILRCLTLLKSCTCQIKVVGRSALISDTLFTASAPLLSLHLHSIYQTSSFAAIKTHIVIAHTLPRLLINASRRLSRSRYTHSAWAANLRRQPLDVR